ncbi:MAG: protein phosphatase 2C domain-containing protein, partial [Kangiellaceae bacterium]|nr:protein phosphatase 2C domain-containing protein [Kangiellaceae bacterium]
MNDREKSKTENRQELDQKNTDLSFGEADENTVLQVKVGQHSIRGIKDENEDFVGSYIPDDLLQRETKGIAVAVADGVSSAEAGKVASQTAVNNFIEDYFQTPDTWSVSHAGQKLLTTINLKLYRKSHEYVNEEKGYLCTFSGMVLKSQIGHIFHAGDSRIYQLVGEGLRQLTKDHVAALGKGRSILARAVGMDSNLHIDYSKVSLKEGDCFMLSSDGVHDFVPDEKIVEVLKQNLKAQQKAERLVELAEQSGSDDNISCIVLEIEKLPQESLNDYNTKLTRLPFPPELEPGMKIDGFLIKKEIFASSRSQLYMVEDEDSGEMMVMKTPSINFEKDTSYID